MPPARPRGPHWPPAGRPPPERRRGAEGLLPLEPEWERRTELTSAYYSYGGPCAAPGSPGLVAARAPPAPPGPASCFCFRGGGVEGFAGAAPRATGKARRGRLDCGEKWGRSQEAPLAPRAGWEQVARAGPGALCRGAETGSGRSRLPRQLPFLPSSPGRPYAGSAGYRGGSRQECAPGDCVARGRSGGGRGGRGVREPRGGAGAAVQPQARGRCFKRGAFGLGEGFILPRRSRRLSYQRNHLRTPEAERQIKKKSHSAKSYWMISLFNPGGPEIPPSKEKTG
ncbi:collagen alpha-1(III) chain-like [Meles meles]|uniref:collagen alpha-1(III) chain-like n=1 Tax=Meles meles TaxID=9662 RepID=UPI001E69C971|nr:collagen alpha-1(III) chain-like [Meles meles]